MSITLLAPCEWPTRTSALVFPAGALFEDLLDRSRPVQVSGHLGLDALGLELRGKAVHAGREHAEPATQQQYLSFGGERAVAPQQSDGDGERLCREWQTTMRACGCSCAAAAAPGSCNRLSHCPPPILQLQRCFVV